MLTSKAPDPNGYTIEFYKVAWQVVGRDFVVTLQSFFINGFMPKSINSTILTFDLKQTNEQRMRDFHWLHVVIASRKSY